MASNEALDPGPSPRGTGTLSAAPLAQRQSIGLLSRRFWVRIPGGAPRVTAGGRVDDRMGGRMRDGTGVTEGIRTPDIQDHNLAL